MSLLEIKSVHCFKKTKCSEEVTYRFVSFQRHKPSVIMGYTRQVVWTGSTDNQYLANQGFVRHAVCLTADSHITG
jgi:hypothetical protein